MPILWLLFYITEFNIYQTSPTHHLRTQKITSETVSWTMMYLNPFDPTYILCLCPAFIEFQTHSIYIFLKLNPACENILLHCTQNYTYYHIREFIYTFHLKMC